MKIFPTTMKDQESKTIKELLKAVIVDRQDSLTNVYSPTYRLLNELYGWVNYNAPDRTLAQEKNKEGKE